MINKSINNNRYTINDMNLIALARGGSCCSTVYINQKSKLIWQCEIGHKWWATPMSIIYLKSWCPVCAGNQKLTIELMHSLAAERGGKCLSDVYKNSKHKLLWECANGHQWHASSFSIRIRRSWCPVCYKNQKI
jgi:hypothetical protein